MEVKIMFESNNTPFTMPVMPANSGYGNNGAWGDDGAWWIIIFVLFFAFGGWGGNGWGGMALIPVTTPILLQRRVRHPVYHR